MPGLRARTRAVFEALKEIEVAANAVRDAEAALAAAKARRMDTIQAARRLPGKVTWAEIAIAAGLADWPSVPNSAVSLAHAWGHDRRTAPPTKRPAPRRTKDGA